LKNEIKAIIFDMGGVFLRTCDETPRMKLAEELGITIEQLKHEVFFSDSAIRSEEGYLDKYAHWEEILHRLKNPNANQAKKYDEQFWSGDYLDESLVEYLGRIKSIFKLGLISNAFQGARKWIESHYQFMQIFDYSLFSYEVHLRKPDARIYHYACRELGVRSDQSVFIDDMLMNVEGAQAAGLFAIQYQNREHLEIELSKITSQVNVSRNPDIE
jgi:epoxide hydrolase-like predicted phosphatase